jgi:hypothetical protein
VFRNAAKRLACQHCPIFPVTNSSCGPKHYVQLVRWDMSYALGWCSTHFSGEKLKATAHVSANELYQSTYCLTGCLLVRIHISKCFLSSGKRSDCEVTFENEQTFCLYTMFAPTQLSLNWCEQRPSNMDDLDSRTKGGWGSLLARGVPASDLVFVP